MSDQVTESQFEESEVIVILRLDLENMVLSQPETTDNQCQNDQFIVSGGTPVPATCGTLTGSHSEYLDKARSVGRMVFADIELSSVHRHGPRQQQPHRADRGDCRGVLQQVILHQDQSDRVLVPVQR